MQTVFDWLSVVIFAGLVVLFLQRSIAPNPKDKLISYAPPALGCAFANQLGNHGYEAAAVLLLLGVVGYSWYVLLRPAH